LAAPAPRGEVDADPKDGVISADELAEALRLSLGPFRVQTGRLSNGRTDDLFDHLDRDRDGQLTRSELTAAQGTLRRLDFDDDEMTSPGELEPFRATAEEEKVEDDAGRGARPVAAPPVVERVAGESPLRAARLLLKKYDTGRDGDPRRPDGRLSPEEFAVAADVFAGADRNGDGSIDAEELRRFLAGAPADLVLDVALPADATHRATARVGGGALARHVQVRQFGEGDVEFAVGHVRLDVHVDDGAATAAEARRAAARRFRSADSNRNGYLEGKELSAENSSPSPFAGLTGLIDRDGDSKLYAPELDDFINRQLDAARARLVLNVSDQGRAIFRVLDLDLDRRLSAREVMRAADRVTSWDADGDGRVSADEIPYHFLVTLSPGGLSGLTAGSVAGPGPAVSSLPSPAPRPGSPARGPDWFRRMDRNRDGDVSRREFLGGRASFDRLDLDRDGLIDPDEASSAGPPPKAAEPPRR
jgi:Ca2+-binding EF-hand superfamily protein